MVRLRVCLFAGAASTVLLAAGAASAQSLIPGTDFDVPQFYGRGKNVSVLERDRPEYQAIGVHAGGFTLYPRLDVGVHSTDNVYPGSTLASQKEKSDQYFTVDPSVNIQSNWGRHSLSAYAGIHETQYSKYSSENTTAWDARVNGRLDVYGDSYVNFGADAQRQYEARGSQNSISLATKPIPYDTQGVYVRGLYGQDRLRASIDADYRNYDFKNVPGATFEDSRDFEQVRVALRGDFALSPDTALFGKVVESDSSYKNGTSIGVALTDKRDSKETRALAGANFDLSDVARGEIGLGYVSRNYDSKAFKDLSGFAASAKVEYFPTQLMTVTFVGQRTVQDAAFNNSGGYFANSIQLGADYEVRRNLIIGAAAGYERDDFQGIDRKDKVVNLSAVARYLVSRNLGIGASVSYADRSSDGTPATLGPEFNVMRFGLSLVFQR